jgi:hypothetical protein
MSIFSSLRYCLGSPTDYGNLYAALAFMPFGLFFDFMDGKVARWRKKASLMGQELDSLADLVSCLALQEKQDNVNRVEDFIRHGPCFRRLRNRSSHTS